MPRVDMQLQVSVCYCPPGMLTYHGNHRATTMKVVKKHLEDCKMKVHFQQVKEEEDEW